MPYGTISAITQNSLNVSVRGGSLTVERVKLEGSSKQYVVDFLKTNKIEIGDQFK